MTTVREVFGEVLAKFLFRQLEIMKVRELAPRFRLFELQGDTLKGASCAPGDKLQVMLGMDARTYTPFAFDGERGTLSLLAFVHGESIGATWARDAKQRDKVRVFGPRGSIALASLAKPVVLFGDETSLGVARALQDSSSGSAFVFETDQPDAASVLEQLGILGAHLVRKQADDSHLPDVEQRLADALARTPRSSLVLTGRAAAIQRLRSALKERSLSAHKSKPYWALGKRGLD